MPSIPSDSVGGARRRICFDSPSQRRGSSVPTPTQRPTSSSQQRRRTAMTSPRGGVSAGRRRLLRRSPPSQRRSEMASLIQRFIAIEEQRVEAELTSARSQEALARAREADAQGPIIMAAAIDRLGDIIRDVTQQSLKAILHFRAPDT